MPKTLLVLAAALAAGPALAQSPGSVPLRENTPSPETTVSRPDARTTSPDVTESVRRDPNARNRTDGRVSPPAAIDTGVKVIAPEKR
ncbi:hypothetical protein [Enterovirga aerilata]|uniref:Uncharacterized protein n=1 Tax=Enterovirga aerilata TaxID=2730920 RepID=A0A849I600_9HYPH|nr:hypothetical protein [Enterovirga sp. DB1703]NNM72751.1 hypothetical protein [Enterovirga sp. DB1703]